MGRKNNGNIEASEQASKETIILGEFRPTGEITKFEKFKGYIKAINEKNSWIVRIPPSMIVISPSNKEQAKQIFSILKQIEKEGYKILKENWEILQNRFGLSKEKTIVSRKQHKSLNLEKLTKKELIQLLRESLKEEE